MDTREILLHYISQELISGSKKKELDEEQDLLDSGLVNSLGVIQLVVFIQKYFGIDVPHSDVTIENFQSVKHIGAYVEARRRDMGDSDD